ncbi:helix-turn-helix transcriptional regulator [Nocardioides sp.]|uniref:helix-turn-helix domain-containing protein n=1 Tax=Nocardioides sp. TaxID=35761 RepID=UPI0025F2EDE9|nr:helix-turn-helix transcriptional regulator [Nocardioides sp.]
MARDSPGCLEPALDLVEAQQTWHMEAADRYGAFNGHYVDHDALHDGQRNDHYEVKVTVHAKRPLSAKSRRTARTLGDYVSTFRRLQGLTAEQVADRAGISRNTLRKLEQGDASVGLDVFLEDCRVLGVLDFVTEGMNRYETAPGQSLAEQNLALPKRVRR